MKYWFFKWMSSLCDGVDVLSSEEENFPVKEAEKIAAKENEKTNYCLDVKIVYTYELTKEEYDLKISNKR